jgi:signal transduction histidine kinase/CheY-like chemotaxis protein
MGLYRQDGNILVRLPDAESAAKPAANTPFTKALAQAVREGRVDMASTVDGTDRILSFRRVGDYPLYVASGYATDAALTQWRRHVAVVAMLTLTPCVGLWLLIVFSLGQLRAEEAAREHWRSEWIKRSSAEASSRQLRRMGALGSLVASVAHDFNNLLMVVSANMELAARKNYTDVKKEITAVKRASVGAEGLARRLMSVARKKPVKHEVVSLSTWLPSATTLIEPALTEKNQFKLRVAPDIWLIQVDVTELESAILNIAVNARDAMPAGGTFSLECRNMSVTNAAKGLPAGDYVVMALSDDGVGVIPSAKEHAFEALFTTKALGAGTGLGLAQVIAMCEQAGGTARLESELGNGTTVLLYLPRHLGAQPTEPPLPRPAADETPAANHVLVVEDNEEVAAGICAVLEVLGCTVRHAVTADQALDILIGGVAFDFILSEVQMPGKMSGIDLAEQVGNLWPKQKFAMMTGYADEVERAELGGIAILAKPFNIEELRALLGGSGR